MFYIGFDTEGNIKKVTNELDDSLQYLEISLEIYSEFIDYKRKMEDYIVVKKQDYVLEKKDGKETVTNNILVVETTNLLKPNSIYLVQNPVSNTIGITHTFEEGKFPPLQTDKIFYVTDVNNSNKLITTLMCSFEDFRDSIHYFDTEYVDECKIITRPDMQNYYRYIGVRIG